MSELNQAPVLDLDGDDSNTVGTGSSNTYFEGGAASGITDGDAMITDADAGDNIVSAIITVTDPQAGDLLTVTLPLPPGIMVDTVNSTDTVLILIGTASRSAYETALGQVGYSSTSDNPTDYGANGDRQITVVVNDGTSDSNVATTTMNIIGTNETPVVPDSPTITVDEQTAVTINSALTVSDADLDARNGGSGDYTGASFTIFRTGGAEAEDLITIASGGSFTVNGANLEAGGLVFATFTGGDGADLVITFTSAGTPATSALVNEVLQHLQYTNTSDEPPASVSLTYSLDDGAPTNASQGPGTAFDSGEVLININAVDDNAIVGDENNNNLFGTDDADVIYGYGGNDTLTGFAGDDALYGGDGNDFIRAGFGNDTIDGGDGFDRIGYFNGSTSGITVDLRITTAQNVGEQGFDTITNVEAVSGTVFADTLIGNDENNWLWGSVSGGGPNNNDYLDGQAGDDHLTLGIGNHTIIGGDGNDTLEFSENGGAEPGITVALWENLAQDTGAGTWTLSGIENLFGGIGDDSLEGDDLDNIIGGSLGSDWLWGYGGNDTLYGDGYVTSINIVPTIFPDLDAEGGNDQLFGGGGNDTLYGGAGNDTLRGGAGDDVIYAGIGNDFINGGFGDDDIDGGDGVDRAAYFEGATSGVTVDLRLQGTAQNVGELGWDTLTNIEALSGTVFGDTLTGDDNNNWLWGSVGGNGGTNNDTIDGQGGDDLITVGIGNHTLIGGSGNDTLEFSENGGAEPGISVALWEDLAQDTGAGTWTLAGFENLFGGIGDDSLEGDDFDNIIGGSLGSDALFGYGGNDTLYGDGFVAPIANVETQFVDSGTEGGNDQLFGGGGNDTMYGGAGNDTLRGNDGSDTVYGGTGDDLIVGGFGDDVIEGGDGYDRAGNYHVNESLGGVTIDLNIVGPQDTGSQGWDSFTSIEYLSGTPFADVLIGDDNDNILWGSTATIDPDPDNLWVSTSNNDTLDGGGGNDLLYVGIGNHSLSGGSGIDTLGFTENFGDDPAIRVSLALQGISQDTGQGFWTLTGIENLSGGDDNDELTGDDSANILAGSSGDDLLSGGDGNDALYGDGVFDSSSPSTGVPTLYSDIGSNGDDTLEGGTGDDEIFGGGGIDTASYQNALGGVEVFLYKNGGGEGESGGADGFDLLHGIENIAGSAFNDQLAGNNLDNVISGGDGNDGLRGNGGNDTLYGGVGNDFLNGSAGDDYVDGGDGYDRAAFYEDAGPSGVTVDLNLQGQAQDTGQGMDILVNIENVSGSIYGDHLTGDEGDNQLWGSASTLTNGTIVTTNNDTLDGRGGNDLLVVGIGNHSLTGGDGIDTVRFTENGAPETGITLSLVLAGQAQDTGNGSWTLSGIENLSGSISDDHLIGDGGSNVLAGDSGNDFLEGGGGSDTLYGDGAILVNAPGSGAIETFPDVSALGGFAGNDTLDGGDGNDQLWGGGGTDTASYTSATGNVSAFLYGGGYGEAFGAAGYDQLHDIENLTGSAFNDILYADDADNVVSGGDGHDDVRGFGGNDQIYGGSGDDLLYGNAGDDYLDGGDGYDRAGFFSGATAGVHVDLNLQGEAQDTGQGMDTLVNIENLSGTQFDDTLIGDEWDNVLWGSAATVSGVVSTENNDTLIGNGGNDLLVAGIGNHIVDGGTGVDTFRFTENGVPETGITLSLLLAGQVQESGNGGWTLTDIENLSGSIADDNLTGDDNANVLAGDLGNDALFGGAGNDTLYGDGQIGWDGHGTGRSGPITTWADATSLYVGGVAGNDILEGGAGDDELWGGGGSDTASWASNTGAVEAYLYNGGFGEALSDDGYDQLHDIENLTGSAFDDLLWGNGLANVLTGGEGHDTLRGAGGNDTLYGGGGDDLLYGNAGDDYMDGGDGYDRVGYFSGAIAGVHVDLNLQGQAQNTGQGMDTLVNIEHVTGTSFSDTLIGDDGNNWLGGQADGNADTISGNGGDDLITNGRGDHLLDGGSGIDTFSFSSTSGISISLALQGAAQNTGQGSMTLTNFENLSGSGYADTLTGDGGANVLAGEQGNDTLVGGAGNDSLFGDGAFFVDTHGIGGSGPITFTSDVGSFGWPSGNDLLEGGLGDDLIDGGGGIDTASYEHASGGVNLDLGDGWADGADGNDTILNVENVIGSNFGDNIGGDGGANVLEGRGGDDGIYGGAGDDIIYGGDGNDFLQGDFGDNDITNIGNDIIYGGNGNDGLRGGAGDDQLYGGANNDLLRGNSGTDYFDGGSEDGEDFNGIGDRVSFYDRRATQGVIADLRDGTISNDGFGNVETMVGIESLGSDTAYVDTFYGNDARNYLAGNRGDFLYGFGADDLFFITSAAAMVDGGTGTDKLTVAVLSGWLSPDTNGDGLAELSAAATSGWNVNLAAGTLADGYGYVGSVTGIENIDGSILADTLIGDANVNLLSGGDGDDTLEGRQGNDTLDGGNGSDRASYANASAAVTVNLLTGTSSGADGNDTLISIEKVLGSAFNDSLTGNDGVNELDGGAGNDFLIGGLGNDNLIGGAGIDRAGYYHTNATLGGVTVSLVAGTATGGGQGNDMLNDIENVSGTPFADVLTGDGNNNWLWGSAATYQVGASTIVSITNNDWLDGGGGNDLLMVGKGNHTLIGGTGNDTIRFTENGGAEANLTISLATAAAQNTGNGSWTISGVENLSGGIGNDSLTGDANANVLAGDSGNDTLNGGNGADTLYGDGRITVDASGVTTLYGDGLTVAGIDNLNGGDGDDFLYGGGGNDVLKGDKDNDTLYGGIGNDTMTGGQGNDRYVIEANSGADTISGFAHLVDRIVFDASSGVTSFAQLTLTKVATNTVITWGNGNSITLTGLKPTDVSAADFQFTANAAGFEHSPQDFSAVYATPHDMFL